MENALKEMLADIESRDKRINEILIGHDVVIGMVEGKLTAMAGKTLNDNPDYHATGDSYTDALAKLAQVIASAQQSG